MSGDEVPVDRLALVFGKACFVNVMVWKQDCVKRLQMKSDLEIRRKLGYELRVGLVG